MKLNLSKHDRICFLGDSITAAGLWVKEVSQWFLDNLPELEIGLYNCGISGKRGREKNVKNVFYSDCIRYFPKYVVIMYGMNDVEVINHGNDDENSLKSIKEAVAGYPDTLNYYIEECKKIGAIPVICSPTPYNEYTDTPATLYKGTDKDLAVFAEMAEKIAKENNLIYVNMRKAIFDHIYENPINEDRVHPNPYGHHLMAEEFLCTIGAKEEREIEKDCVISPKNEKRYETEQILRNLMFVERLWQGEDGTKSIEDQKKYAKEYSEKQEDKRWLEWVKEFVENVDYKDELRGQIVKLTLDMYK